MNATEHKDLEDKAKQVEEFLEAARAVQNGPDKSRHLACAITRVEEGMLWLDKHLKTVK